MQDNQTTEPAVICQETENLEEYAGETIPDPWDDPSQTDWANRTSEVN